jgi:predicted aconitase with swiveling domain
VVCARADITTASGCAIANIPVVDLPEGAPAIKQGLIAKVEADDGRITVKV